MADAKRKTGETPALEWIAAGIGALLLLFLLVVIGREAIDGEAAELPVIEVAVTGIAPSGSGHVVSFEARNRTDGTAAAVEIEGVLKAGGAEIESSSATIDYVPGKRAPSRAGCSLPAIRARGARGSRAWVPEALKLYFGCGPWPLWSVDRKQLSPAGQREEPPHDRCHRLHPTQGLDLEQG